MDETLFEEADRVIGLTELAHQDICYVLDWFEFWWLLSAYTDTVDCGDGWRRLCNHWIASMAYNNILWHSLTPINMARISENLTRKHFFQVFCSHFPYNRLGPHPAVLRHQLDCFEEALSIGLLPVCHCFLVDCLSKLFLPILNAQPKNVPQLLCPPWRSSILKICVLQSVYTVAETREMCPRSLDLSLVGNTCSFPLPY